MTNRKSQISISIIFKSKQLEENIQFDYYLFCFPDSKIGFRFHNNDYIMEINDIDYFWIWILLGFIVFKILGI